MKMRAAITCTTFAEYRKRTGVIASAAMRREYRELRNLTAAMLGA